MLHGMGTPEDVQSAIQTCRDEISGLTPQKLLKFSHNFCISDESQVFYHHDADLCDPNQIADMFKFIQQKYLRSPDILVNNAGIHAHKL